ncbi:SHOCT domain-containing protein [Klebsiella aerogenes]
MANSRYDVEIRGDNKSLTTAVNKSMDELNKLDSVANGLFGDLTGPLNNLKGGLNTISSMTPALRGLGAAGLVAGAGLAAIAKASEVVNVLNEVNTNTGVSIEMLQQLQKEFKSTGMDVEKFGDINKDAMDKLGDSFRNGGGGIADDLKEWGIGLDSLTKYAGDAEGGIKSVIDVFYQMKDAGKSQSEIVNAMESMASDSSHLISTLEQYKGTQEALNAVQDRSVAVTTEQASEFTRLQQNLNNSRDHMNNLLIDGVYPLIRGINDIWAAFGGGDENDPRNRLIQLDTELGQINSRYARINTTLMTQSQIEDLNARKSKELADVHEKISQARYDIESKRAKQKAEENFRITKGEEEAKLRIKKAADDKAKELADKAKTAADKAARESKAAYEKMMKERQTALETMSSLNISTIKREERAYASQANQMQQSLLKLKQLKESGYLTDAQYEEKRKQMLANSAKEFEDSIKASVASIGEVANAVNQIYENQRQELSARHAQGLLDQKAYNEQLQALEADHKAKIDAIHGVDSNLENAKNLSALGFATDDEQMQIQMQALDEQIQKMREQNQSMYDNELISYDDFLKQKQRLDQAYSVKSKAISMAEIQTKMQMYNGFAQGMAGVIGGIAGENSKAAQAAFAVAKGTAIAQGMLNAYESATTAMAKYPGPLGYALAASSYASVLGQVMSMKSVSPNGMAHDGIDNIPKEGTWLLDGGERVVDQRTNGDLKDFLESNKDGGNQTIDARMTINGNVTDERWFAVQLKKHQQAITSIVQDGNRRKM